MLIGGRWAASDARMAVRARDGVLGHTWGDRHPRCPLSEVDEAFRHGLAVSGVLKVKRIFFLDTTCGHPKGSREKYSIVEILIDWV